MSFPQQRRIDLTDWQLRVPRGKPDVPNTGMVVAVGTDLQRIRDEFRARGQRPCGVKAADMGRCYHGAHCVNGTRCWAALEVEL